VHSFHRRPQQSPRLPVLFIRSQRAGLSDKATNAYAARTPPPESRTRHPPERSAPPGNQCPPHRTQSCDRFRAPRSNTVPRQASRRLHLHPQQFLPGIDDEVISAALSPRLRHRQAQLCRLIKERRLRQLPHPFPAAIPVPPLLLRHSPQTPDLRRIAGGKNLNLTPVRGLGAGRSRNTPADPRNPTKKPRSPEQGFPFLLTAES
jgi:hypothetical protein